MLSARLIPCLLLKGSGLVKTTRFKNPKYLGDPINAVRIFNDKCADELVFLDISATRESREPSYELISRIATECFMPFAYGGGVTSLQIARKIISQGAEKVVVNTEAIENPSFITELAEYLGSQSVVVSIDYKKNFWGRNKVYTRCGSRSTGNDPVCIAREAEKRGAGEIFLNCIDRDSMMQGYDLSVIQEVSRAVDIPVIASGGAGEWSDFKSARDAGAAAMAAGSAFVFQGERRAFLIRYPSEQEMLELLA